jgi:hypothetical protein
MIVALCNSHVISSFDFKVYLGLISLFYLPEPDTLVQPQWQFVLSGRLLRRGKQNRTGKELRKQVHLPEHLIVKKSIKVNYWKVK